MSDECFRWLHLTDLHYDQGRYQDDWDDIFVALVKDIQLMQNKLGLFHAIFFTGDLVQSGQAKQFEGLNDFLRKLKQKLGGDEFDPVFCAVPGNHDLQRPAQLDAVLGDFAAISSRSPKVGEQFWQKINKSTHWPTINTAFSNYQDWWSDFDVFKKAQSEKLGGVPGDFVASISHGDFNIGVMGLNTAFLQLADGDYEKKLVVNKRQRSLLLSDPDNWQQQHAISFVLTHHPAHWLTPQAQAEFKEITQLPRFAYHLCGHLHQARQEYHQVNGIENLRMFQGASLFGEDDYQQLSVKAPRMHGYSIGSLRVGGDKVRIRFWPRKYQKEQKKFVRNYDFNLEELDGGTKEDIIAMAQYISTQVMPRQRKKTNKSKPQVQDSELIKKVILSIKNELNKPASAKLSAYIKAELQEIFSNQTLPLADQLVAYAQNDLLFCIALLTKGVKEAISFQSSVASPEENQLWQSSQIILGWIILMAVDEKRLAVHQQKQKAGELELVYQELCAIEVLTSRIKGTYARFSLKQEADERVVMGKNHISLAQIGEPGILQQDIMAFMRQDIWFKLFHENKVATLTARDLARMSATVRARAYLDEYYFILLPKGYWANETLRGATMQLINEMPDLQIVLPIQSQKENDTLLLVPEIDLMASIEEFLAAGPKLSKAEAIA